MGFIIDKTIHIVLLLYVVFSFFQSSSQQCGRIKNCTRLISYAIFQQGACGRAARCYWELLHLEKSLLNDANNTDEYEKVIKDSLCNIPTLGAYENARALDDDKDEYHVCGPDVDASESFLFYPMTTLYTYRHGKKDKFLYRMSNCTDWESTCGEMLQNKIDDLCAELTLVSLQTLEKSFRMKLRNQNFYEIAVLHPDDLKKIGLRLTSPGGRFNNCSLLNFRRKRSDDAESESLGSPTFTDSYGFNEVDRSIRGPWYDLYILYEADPKQTMSLLPAEDRWWDETKSYQQLANYLPSDMLMDIDKAIQCVYEHANSPEMKHEREKFCSGDSSFICVDESESKQNVCNAQLGQPFRHDIDGEDVPSKN